MAHARVCVCVCVCVDRERHTYTQIYLFIYIKKFGHMIVDSLENQGRAAVQQFKSTAHLLAEFPSCWGEASLRSIQALD